LRYAQLLLLLRSLCSWLPVMNTKGQWPTGLSVSAVAGLLARSLGLLVDNEGTLLRNAVAPDGTISGQAASSPTLSGSTASGPSPVGPLAAGAPAPIAARAVEAVPAAPGDGRGQVGGADRTGDSDVVMRQAARENFTVATRILPRRSRDHLLALYGFARLTDDIGDKAPGDRLAQLDWLEAELGRAIAGTASHPLLVRLGETVRTCGLDPEPLRRLIEANRQDQSVHRYRSWGDLLGYCRLSADPIGELVLGIFGLATDERVRLSNLVCTGLQLAEHWQDVGEDFAAGRVYLPADDVQRFGVTPWDLRATTASPALRGLVAFEVAKTRTMLTDGAQLVGLLTGRVRFAVAGFVAGGLAALDAIAAANFDVLGSPVRPARTRTLGYVGRLVVGREATGPWG
jgi:squalene synthase HpnC